MNSFLEKINQDLKKALIKKEELIVSVLRMLNSAIHNKEIEKRTKLSKTSAFAEAASFAEVASATKAESEDREKLNKLEQESKLSEEEVMEVIFSEAKKRKDSIVEFRKGNRQDLADKETEELEILKKYLPEQMSEEQIKEEAKKVIAEINAVGPQDTGKVMSALMPKLKGKTEGGIVSKIVGELLKK